MRLLWARIKGTVAVVVLCTPLAWVHHLNQWAARAMWCQDVEEALNR